MISMATNTNEQWAKNIWRIQNFSRKITIKVSQNICNCLAVHAVFSIFPIISQWKNLSCHSNQTKEPVFMKKKTNLQSPSPRMIQVKFGPNRPVPSEEMLFESTVKILKIGTP